MGSIAQQRSATGRAGASSERSGSFTAAVPAICVTATSSRCLHRRCFRWREKPGVRCNAQLERALVSWIITTVMPICWLEVG